MERVSVGVVAADAAEVAPVPLTFDAVTVKVYAVPLVSPVTVQLVSGVAGSVEVSVHDFVGATATPPT